MSVQQRRFGADETHQVIAAREDVVAVVVAVVVVDEAAGNGGVFGVGGVAVNEVADATIVLRHRREVAQTSVDAAGQAEGFDAVPRDRVGLDEL